MSDCDKTKPDITAAIRMNPDNHAILDYLRGQAHEGLHPC
jgi:hypothetical protein